MFDYVNNYVINIPICNKGGDMSKNRFQKIMPLAFKRLVCGFSSGLLAIIIYSGVTFTVTSFSKGLNPIKYSRVLSVQTATNMGEFVIPATYGAAASALHPVLGAMTLGLYGGYVKSNATFNFVTRERGYKEGAIIGIIFFFAYLIAYYLMNKWAAFLNRKITNNILFWLVFSLSPLYLIFTTFGVLYVLSI